MREIRERSTLRRALYARPTIVAIILLALLTAHGAWGMYQKHVEARDRREKAESELSSLQARAESLEASLSHLESPRGREEAIRGKFMVAKDGEGVMIVVDRSGATATPVVEKPGIWARAKAALTPGE